MHIINWKYLLHFTWMSFAWKVTALIMILFDSMCAMRFESPDNDFVWHVCVAKRLESPDNGLVWHVCVPWDLRPLIKILCDMYMYHIIFENKWYLRALTMILCGMHMCYVINVINLTAHLSDFEVGLPIQVGGLNVTHSLWLTETLTEYSRYMTLCNIIFSPQHLASDVRSK